MVESAMRPGPEARYKDTPTDSTSLAQPTASTNVCVLYSVPLVRGQDGAYNADVRKEIF